LELFQWLLDPNSGLCKVKNGMVRFTGRRWPPTAALLAWFLVKQIISAHYVARLELKTIRYLIGDLNPITKIRHSLQNMSISKSIGSVISKIVDGSDDSNTFDIRELFEHFLRRFFPIYHLKCIPEKDLYLLFNGPDK
jgi:hypothetical protein